MLTPQGNKTVEDLNPGLEKILPVEEGFMVYNVEGIRMKATTTVDQDGYMVYQSTSTRVLHRGSPSEAELLFSPQQLAPIR